MIQSWRAGSRVGTTLIEVTVALALLATVTVVTLDLLARARRSFRIADAHAYEQQSIRTAFDSLTRELRLAGFNHDPTGSVVRIDEPIEGAWSTAIVIRADLDAGTGDASDPEVLLAGGAYSTVSTGNDEIVGYALARSDGSGPDSLVFEADVQGVPRDGRTELVTIDDVALSHGDPPYTLYRFSVRHDSSTVRRDPVIDGVAKLTFVYFDADGRVVPAPGGRDDAVEGGVLKRASIRRVRIVLEGVRPEAGRDGFALAGDVTPRNLGLLGVRER